ncbi:hypothetical protein C0584_05860 [Candidatus Parcubacteria bacterium]|nr:MAG: hypothetical protein C0584_05860 [Candidatus Parcubacteria bacterium]
MIKQLARGVIYFENKKKEEVVDVFNNFRFDEAGFKIFEKITINNTTLETPGVFINGEINEKYTSDNVVRLFRKLMKLEVENKNADLSIEREDELESLSREREFDFYFVYSFKKSDIKDNLKKLKLEICENCLLKTRDMGYLAGEQLSGIEVFTNHDITEKINNVFLKNNLEPQSSKKIEF